MKLPATLRRLLLQRQCVAFVGAGFSMACGMPGWAELLQRLIDEARSGMSDLNQQRVVEMAEHSLSRGNYPLAASLVRQMLNKVELNRAIIRQYSNEAFHAAPPHKKKRMEGRLRNLVRAPWAGIITTNYDMLVESALGTFTTGSYAECGVGDQQLGIILCGQSSSSKFFVKIHGSVKGGGYVLGTEEYDATYLAAPAVETFLAASMLRYHHIFIGCSLEDEILRLRRRLCQHFAYTVPQAYAVMPRNMDNESRRQWLEDNAQIVSLLYDMDGELSAPDGHGGLDEFLREAALIGEVEVDPGCGPLSVGLMKDLRNLPLQERINSIGQVNKELLRAARRLQEDGGMSHADIVDMELEFAERYATTPNERIYRVLFLCAIGLLEPRASEGDVIYAYPHDPSLVG